MTDRPPLPRYDQLPVRPGAPRGSSWGVWGDDDVLGCLNLLTPERARAGLACATEGKVFPLDLPVGVPDPPLFGRAAPRHVVKDLVHGHDDELHELNTQSSTQWDGFRHIRHLAHGFYNGLPDEAHGMHHWARRGIVGRAVVADVARWRQHVGRPLRPDEPDVIEPDDLLATLDHQGVEVEPGDILLLRTGWMAWYRSLDEAGRAALGAGAVVRACGLRPGDRTAQVLWDLHIAAVAADNPALEVFPRGCLHPDLTGDALTAAIADPDLGHEVFLHASLLPLLGLPIGELFDLDALAGDCAADGRWTCLVTSAPLHVVHGVASPPNALALK